MKEEKIKSQAKKWAELFVKSEEEFLKDYQCTVAVGRYDGITIQILVKLAQAYANFILKIISRADTIAQQAAILEEYRKCTGIS